MRVRFGGDDFAGVFANLGWNVIEFQLGVDFLFGAAGDAAFRLERRECVFVERVAHVVGAAAQLDVVLASSR